MREWADVAVLAKAKNLQGGFVVRSAAGLPFLLEEGMEVAFVPPVLDAPRRAHVGEIVSQGSDFLVFFDEVSNRSLAEHLAGCHCLVRRDELPEGVLERGTRGIVGWRVEDREAGFSGVVTGVVENTSQALLELTSSQGATVLVPFVDEFIEGYDEDGQILNIKAPSGLYSL